MQDESLTVLKGLLSGGTISYQAIFSKAFRSIPIGVYLSQMYFWQENSRYKSKETHQQIEGRTFICRTADEWFDETGMSAEQQSKARETLRPFGVLLEKKAGMPAKLWQHIDLESLVTVINRYLETGSPVTVDYRSKERLNTRSSNGKFRQQVTVKNRPTYVESFESEEESFESVSTADAAAHAEPPQSKKSKTKKLASPAAPKPEGWTKQWATAFDEVDKEKCTASGIPYERFIWTVCAEQSFAHLRNLREKAIIPSLTEKRKREGKEGPISEPELLISARAVFSLAWDYFQRIAAETGGTRHYTPQSVYKNFNTLKIAKQQQYAAATRPASQSSTRIGIHQQHHNALAEYAVAAQLRIIGGSQGGPSETPFAAGYAHEVEGIVVSTEFR